jgi:hypothetical protein
MNAQHIIRNAVTILLILTLANLAASFAALRAVRSVRDDNKAHIQRIDDALVRLADTTNRLCAQRGADCAQTVLVTAPSTN